ncbi:hypothetical protein R3P38DRAFT_2844334 [Favolaschia claudopus]|uniref:Uncharacterized protein n=1 Tax=Favolaschia claudopus TaxID=2862362 RepID=A0AAW0E2R7_9AGAR
MGHHHPNSWLDRLLVLSCLFATVYARYVPLLQPGFFFDYNIPTQPVPIPITEQCETLHLKWGREGAIGPNPVAPYSMVVYTSTFITPFTIAAGDGLSFDWAVPFAPGTQYQICMWDKNGVPGGCQAMYTVVKNSTVANPTCQNVTFPTLMQVEATVPNGPMSQFGFIDQCTDLFVTPKSGKPPFTLTVAPALHPPYNITVNSMSTIDWTVSLSWSFPFFLSLTSSDGQMWSNGPLHAGGRGPDGCLAPGSIPSSKAHSIAVGAGVGGAFAAAVVASLLTYLYFRFIRPRLNQEHPRIDAYEWPTYGSEKSPIQRTRPRLYSEAQTALTWTTVDDVRSSQIISPGTHNNNSNNRASQMMSPGGQTQIVSPGGASQIASPAPTWQTSRRRTSQIMSPSSNIASPSSALPRRTTTYVLHHDAGRAPVTVITEAEEVVELPPRYRSETGGSVVEGGAGAREAAPPVPEKQRRMRNDPAVERMREQMQQSQPQTQPELEPSTSGLPPS